MCENKRISILDLPLSKHNFEILAKELYIYPIILSLL